MNGAAGSLNGVVVVDKPGGMTSHDVVARIRKGFSNVRTGHLGTLDPMATGVLPVCLGKATRISQFLSAAPKEYIGDIRLGFSTATYDREGKRTSDEKVFQGDRALVIDAMRQFTGAIDQVPPTFSAKKIRGVRSYKLARKGQPVENPPVRVDVELFELIEFRPPVASFRVVCSPGTYIRSLAHDLGQALGCGAHLLSLRRLRSGQFAIAQAVLPENVSVNDVIPLESFLGDWPLIEVSGAEEDKVLHGSAVRRELDEGYARIFNKQGEFLAIAVVESGWAHPRIVLTSQASVTENI